MRYYLDTEFDGFGGDLISLALVREDRESIYLVYQETAKDEWVQKNVLPILWDIPSPMPGMAYKVDHMAGALEIADFLKGDLCPDIITDWPDDVRYFCGAVITGPGQMININSLSFDVRRVDAYPTKLPGAVQHNSYWDAKALWHLFEQ